jgi:uncharacterized protein YndB with AHSA1/START domain
MKWLWRILGTVVALILILIAVGFLLPSRYKVQRSIEVAAPPDKVYTLIADPREWKRWTVWNRRDPAMKIEYAGPPSGVGAKWSWQSRSEGSGAMEFTAAMPGQRLGYRLSFPEFGIQSDGVLLLETFGGGTRVIWTNEGDMGSSPLNRWFGVMMDTLVGPDFEAGLANLKQLAES